MYRKSDAMKESLTFYLTSSRLEDDFAMGQKEALK